MLFPLLDPKVISGLANSILSNATQRGITLEDHAQQILSEEISSAITQFYAPLLPLLKQLPDDITATRAAVQTIETYLGMVLSGGVSIGGLPITFPGATTLAAKIG